MDERLRFVARLLEGRDGVLCREFDREEMGGVCRGVGYLAQDRLQDLPATRIAGLEGLTDRSAPALSAGQPAAVSDRDADRAAQEGASELGRAEDPREAQAPAPMGIQPAGDQHRARGARSPRPGQPRRRKPLQGPRHAAVPADAAQRSVVRRLQGRVHARRSALLLSADDHRLRQPLPARCEALATTKEIYAFTVFERVFKDFGLPLAIRTDNGVPFASAHASSA